MGRDTRCWARAVVTGGVVIAAVLTGGCTGDGGAPAAPPSDAVDARVTAADLDTARALQPGDRLTHRRTYRGQFTARRTAGPIALGPDGSVLVNVNPPVLPGPVIGQASVEWWRGGRRTVVSDGKVTRVGGPSQTFGGSACGSPPVWLETRSVSLDRQDWRIWTRLPRQPRPTLLGSSEQMLPGPDPVPVPDLASPVANASMAYWPIIREVRGELRVAIAGRPLRGTTEPRVHVERATMPQVLANGDLLFVRRHREDARIPVDQVQVRRLRRGVETLVRTVVVPPTARASAFVARGDRLALTVNAPDVAPQQPSNEATLVTWREPRLAADTQRSTAEPDVLRVRLHGRGSELALVGQDVAWGNGSGATDGGQYVLDVARRQVYRIATNPAISHVHACGPHIAWTVRRPDPGVGDFVVARWR